MVNDFPPLYRLGNELTNSRRWLQWVKDSEFCVIRVASAAERKQYLVPMSGPDAPPQAEQYVPRIEKENVGDCETRLADPRRPLD